MATAVPAVADDQKGLTVKDVHFYIAMARVRVKHVDASKGGKVLRSTFPFEVQFDSHDPIKRSNTLQQKLVDAQKQCETDVLHKLYCENPGNKHWLQWKCNYRTDIVDWLIEKVP